MSFVTVCCILKTKTSLLDILKIVSMQISKKLIKTKTKFKFKIQTTTLETVNYSLLVAVIEI